MKKLLYVITLLLLLSIFTSCNNSSKSTNSNLKSDISNSQDSNTSEFKFAIYVVKDSLTTALTKININELTLENEPIITEKDILAYYWKSSVFKMDISVFDKKLNHAASLTGTPFVLMANGERIYLGTLWTPMSSAIPPKETPVLNILGSPQTISNLKKDGYNVSPKSEDVYVEISGPLKGKDKRQDERIYKALKETGILKE